MRGHRHGWGDSLALKMEVLEEFESAAANGSAKERHLLLVEGWRTRRLEYMREYLRAYNARPDVKAKRRQRDRRPDVKAKRRTYLARPDVRARTRAYGAKYRVTYRQRPDVKAKRVAQQAKYASRPEVRARINARRRASAAAKRVTAARREAA